MDYNSVKETALLWGIDPTRITLLCRQGRIPGALQKGREWLIPKDAGKPRDARRKPEKPEPEKPFFPFFLYHFLADGSDRGILSPEKQTLYDGQKLYVTGELDRAAGALDILIEGTADRYILTGALVTRGFVAIERREVRQYDRCLRQLQDILRDDFPYRQDLQYFLWDLQSYAKGSEKWAAEFRIDPGQTILPETGAYLLTTATYSALINLAVNNAPVDTTPLELACIGFEDRGIFFSAQMMHIFLAGIYFLRGQRDYCRNHVQKVLLTAAEQNSYYPLAVAQRYLGDIYDELFLTCSPEAARKAAERSARFNKGIKAIYKFYSARTELLQLTRRDYEYIMFAIQKTQNAEIARLKGITPPTVSKYYSRLYEKVGVRNKKELAEYFRRSILIN